MNIAIRFEADQVANKSAYNEINANLSIDSNSTEIEIPISDLQFRMLALFLVFLSSILGIAPTSMGYFASLMANGEYSDSLYILRAFTAGTNFEWMLPCWQPMYPSANFSLKIGVMLSLSTVHVIADAFEDLDGLAGNFPVASIFITAGVYVMSAAENLSLHSFKNLVCSCPLL